MPLLPRLLVSNGKIDSSVLIPAVTSWMAAEKCSTDETLSDHMHRLFAVLKEVQNIIRAIFAGEKGGEIQYLDNETDLSLGVKMQLPTILV